MPSLLIAHNLGIQSSLLEFSPEIGNVRYFVDPKIWLSSFFLLGNMVDPSSFCPSPTPHSPVWIKRSYPSHCFNFHGYFFPKLLHAFVWLSFICIFCHGTYKSLYLEEWKTGDCFRESGYGLDVLALVLLVHAKLPVFFTRNSYTFLLSDCSMKYFEVPTPLAPLLLIWRCFSLKWTNRRSCCWRLPYLCSTLGSV